jgi:ABC-type transport system involved in cytochrome c biogenesis permease component
MLDSTLHRPRRLRDTRFGRFVLLSLLMFPVTIPIVIGAVRMFAAFIRLMLEIR